MTPNLHRQVPCSDHPRNNRGERSESGDLSHMPALVASFTRQEDTMGMQEGRLRHQQLFFSH